MCHTNDVLCSYTTHIVQHVFLSSVPKYDLQSYSNLANDIFCSANHRLLDSGAIQRKRKKAMKFNGSPLKYRKKERDKKSTPPGLSHIALT